VSEHYWNAQAYDTLSDPMFAWGMAVLETLELRGDERVLDAGCGSGRLTEELLKRIPRGELVALDSSAEMLAQARQRLGGRPNVEFAQASLENFTLGAPVEGIFSNAVFHWVPDHAAMFRALHAAQAPGGWLLAQFGGVGNLARTLARAEKVTSDPRFRAHLGRFEAGPHFEDVAATRARMEAAGFSVEQASLHEERPLFEQPARYRAFLETVILRKVVAALPPALRDELLERVVEQSWREDGCYSFDYVRLTVRARA
jgi:trans-aconitate 2-methyltransferase